MMFETSYDSSIIASLKHHMLPGNAIGSRQGSVGLAFEYPDEFEIRFAPSVRSYLYSIGTSVLTGMTINYNGESIPVFYEDTGAPVSISMSLSFQETAIQTKDGFMDSREADVDFDKDIANSSLVQGTVGALNTIAAGPGGNGAV